MTIQQHNLARMRLYEEPNGSFAADGSGTMGNYLECPVREGSFPTLKLGKTMESPQHLQQWIDGMAEKVALPKDWTLDSLVFNLETFTTRATNAVAAAQGSLGRMLKIVMGGENLGTGTTVNDASATTTSAILTSVAGFAVGGAIGFATGANGELEIREIESISGSTVTWKLALTAAPANSSTAYGAATYHMGLGNGDVVTSAQVAWEGLEQDDRWLLLGGQASSFALDVGPGIIPSATFGLKGVQWHNADGALTAGTLTGSTLGVSTYTNNTTLVVKDSEFRVATVGTSTLSGTLIDAPSITINPSVNYVSHRTPAGTETVARWIRLHQPPVVSGTYQVPFEAVTDFTSRDNKTDIAIFYQIGTSATDGGILISVPTAQIVNVQRVDIGGIAGQEITWEGRLDTDTTEGTASALGQSPFRIHLV